jgi:tripartite-type tricarboxylate transporter receptor subunit TctC
MKTPKWRENLKRYEWTPFVKTGGELDRFIASEQRRVHEVVGDLGIGG